MQGRRVSRLRNFKFCAWVSAWAWVLGSIKYKTEKEGYTIISCMKFSSLSLALHPKLKYIPQPDLCKLIYIIDDPDSGCDFPKESIHTSIQTHSHATSLQCRCHNQAVMSPDVQSHHTSRYPEVHYIKYIIIYLVYLNPDLLAERV